MLKGKTKLIVHLTGRNAFVGKLFEGTVFGRGCPRISYFQDLEQLINTYNTEPDLNRRIAIVQSIEQWNFRLVRSKSRYARGPAANKVINRRTYFLFIGKINLSALATCLIVVNKTTNLLVYRGPTVVNTRRKTPCVQGAECRYRIRTKSYFFLNKII